MLTESFGQDRSQARSMVISDRGIVATSQTLASQAGAQVLARGGSAMDAAIAANAALGVVEPESCGMGGDLFAIYWDAKTGKLTAINASGWAPKGLTIEFLKSQGHRRNAAGGHPSVTVPGCVDGWAKLHQRFGKLPWNDLFQPAIYFAEHGYPGHRDDRRRLEDGGGEARRGPATRATRFPARRRTRPASGRCSAIRKWPRALKLIAERRAGRRSIAAPSRKAILKTSRAARRQDDRRPIWRSSSRMGRADLHRLSRLEGLRAAAQRPGHRRARDAEHPVAYSRWPTTRRAASEELHVQIEAQKLAYRRPAPLRGRPALQPKCPWRACSRWTTRASAPSRSIRSKASCEVPPGKPPLSHGDTIYLSVVDRDGNIVSLIQSLYQHFGSGVVVDDYGFALQNRGGLFELDPQPSQRAGAAQAAVPHHHSGVHGEGRRAHGLRHHGRTEPGAGARAVRLQRGGPRDEHPGGAGSAALHQD